jgi:hypothetical protein
MVSHPFDINHGREYVLYLFRCQLLICILHSIFKDSKLQKALCSRLQHR